MRARRRADPAERRHKLRAASVAAAGSVHRADFGLRDPILADVHVYAAAVGITRAAYDLPLAARERDIRQLGVVTVPNIAAHPAPRDGDQECRHSN